MVNFSSSIMNSMGISLGGLELATDYLYANSDMYEPELTEIKTTISHKQCRPVNRIKPIKPKTSTQSIIRKFSIIPENKQPNNDNNICDEIIDVSPIIKVQADDFDFSFDEEKDIDKQDKIGLDTDDKTGDTDDDNTDDNGDDLGLDEIDDIYDEDDTNDEDDDSTDEEDDNGDDLGLDEIDYEDDDDNTDDNDDDLGLDEIDDIYDEDDNDVDIGLDNNEDNDVDIDIDELESTQDKVEQPKIVDTQEKMVEEQAQDNEEDEFGLDDIDDIEEDTEEDEFDIDNEDEEDEFGLDDIDDIEEDTEEDDLPASVVNTTKNSIEIEQVKQADKQVSVKSSTVAQDTPKVLDSERKMMERIKQLEEQVQRLSSVKAAPQTSNVVIKNNKKDLSLTNTEKSEACKTPDKQADYDRYSIMQVDSLFKEVRDYALKLGVEQRTIELVKLEEKFGAMNIRKLINKSFLIKIGKGVTMGR